MKPPADTSPREGTQPPGHGTRLPLYAVLVLQFVNIGRPQDIAYPLRALRPGILAVGLAALCVLLWWRSVPGRGLFETRALKRFRNLLILMIALVPLSQIPEKSIYYLGTEFWMTVFYLVVFSHFVRTAEDLKRSASVMVLSSLLLAAALVARRGSGGRLSMGTMYDPNDIALLFVSILPLALYLAKFSGSKLMRILSLCTVPLSLLAVGLTQSRGAFLGLCVLFLVWFFQKSHPRQSRLKVGKIALLVLIVATFWVAVPDSFWQRWETLGEEDATGSGRITVWKRIGRMMVWYPLGVGPGCFTSSYGRLLSEGRFEMTDDEVRNRAWVTAHNSYLLVAGELGIPGLFLYLLWIGGMIRSTGRVWRQASASDADDERLWICSMVRLGLIGFAVPATFLSQSFSYILLTYCGYVAVLERSVEAGPGPAPPAGAGTPPAPR